MSPSSGGSLAVFLFPCLGASVFYMKWDNLKKNMCPKCNLDWTKADNAHFGAMVVICKCDFKITEMRMLEIVNDRVNKDLICEEGVEK